MLFTSTLSKIIVPAVFVAGIIHMMKDLVWFMPRIFGKAWMELTGQQLKPARQWLAAGIIGH